jgi:hypothetical protein
VGIRRGDGFSHGTFRGTPFLITYKRGTLIERMFCRLKNRRIATRYDRHAQNHLSGLAHEAIMIAWI